MTAADVWASVSAWPWDGIGTWVGALVAVISAVASWRKAGEAKQMRDEIAGRKAHGELSGLNGILQSALRAMQKYANGMSPTYRSGANPDEDALAVVAVTNEMARLRVILDKAFGKASVGKVVNKLDKLLADFGNAPNNPNDSVRVLKGNDIFAALKELSGNFKSEIDKHTLS